MNFTDIFIKRPVFATVLSLIILLVGIKAYFMLHVRLYPRIDASVINVSVNYNGADAALMEGFVTTPIENAIAGVDGIDYMISSSSANTTSISIYFTLGYNIDAAVTDVSAKVSSVRWKLPKEIDDPVVAKKDPNASPSMYIVFVSNTLTLGEITDYLERVVQPQVQTLPGVSAADIYGAREYAMRVWLNPKLMAAHNVVASDIVNTLNRQNLQAPSGPIKSDFQRFNIKTMSTLHTGEEFSKMVIRSVDGHLVRINDVGWAELGAKSTDFSVIADDKQALILAITPSPIANPVDVSAEVNELLPTLQRTMPTGLYSTVMWDSSSFILESIRDVKKTIIEAALCVILVVFLFLGSWRVLLIPAVTIPLSLIGVCGVMLALGYTLNTITYLAAVLAIGMVVDDAIVVLENVHRHIVEGKTPMEAALIGAREIQFAVIAMTFTLAAVYAPIGFLTGLIGALFREFSFTLAGSVIISGFVALTLSPMMCSKVINAGTLNGRLAHYAHHFSELLTHKYRLILTHILQHNKKIVIAVMAIVVTASIFLARSIPSELAPREDIGAVIVAIKSPTSANVHYTERGTKPIPGIFKTIPEKQSYLLVNGHPDVNAGLAILILEPWSERKRTSDQIITALFPKLWMIPGVLAFPMNPSMLPGAGGSTPVQIQIQTMGSYDELNNIMQKLKTTLIDNPHWVNVDTSIKMDQPQYNINLDRNKAGDMGVSMYDVGLTINIALGEPKVGHFDVMGRSYDVVPQLDEPYRKAADMLKDLNVRTQSGEIVPISNLVTINEILQPQSLDHFQQLRSASLTASLRPGYTLGQALEDFNVIAKQIVPSYMQIDYAGETRQFIQTRGMMEATFAFAVIFIFLVLAAQFESFRSPFVVLFSVPLSVFGALLTMKMVGCTLSIYSQIGLVTLVGLISKHGILMVEFANQLQDEGKDRLEAIIEAASIRLRPILMTTGAMVLGAVPLALAHGAGAVSRQQIGWVILGGMMIGTIFTLFVVPTMYTYFATKRSKIE